jgi:hypothetical protein
LFRSQNREWVNKLDEELGEKPNQSREEKSVEKPGEKLKETVETPPSTPVSAVYVPATQLPKRYYTR